LVIDTDENKQDAENDEGKGHDFVVPEDCAPSIAEKVGSILAKGDVPPSVGTPLDEIMFEPAEEVVWPDDVMDAVPAVEEVSLEDVEDVEDVALKAEVIHALRLLNALVNASVN
jgi:hypothetical protein